jgi:uncharacterized protein (DUF58 family)
VALRAAALARAPWPPGAFLRARLAAWIRRRQGLDALPVRLERRRLYILPTRAGSACGALLLLMLLAGLNYANSLALLLTFVLIAFALVAMQLCHRNLLGLEVSAVLASPAFAGGSGELRVTLANRGSEPRRQLEAMLPAGAAALTDLPPGAQRPLELAVPAKRRGLLPLERLKITTTYPFGLFRAWTWLHTRTEMLIYPQPRGALPLPADRGGRPGERLAVSTGGDEWAGLRPFRDGDSPRQVDWKAYAREAPLLVKEYVQGSAELRWLDLAQLPGSDLEVKLSQLARWIVEAEACGERYGLRLPGVELAPERGPEHRHRTLAALARFGCDAL